MTDVTQTAGRVQWRARIPLLGAFAALFMLSWAYTLYMQWGMQHMDIGAGMAIMPAMTDYGFKDLCLILVMWTMMMSAMMLPSASPLVLAYFDTRRADKEFGHPLLATGLLVAGYLAVWSAFSLAATMLQWALLEAALITPMLESASAPMSGLILIGAGVFQFSSIKDKCLTGCRSPIQFLLSAGRDNTRSAFTLGLKNGAICLGCCWALMLLPLALGVMSLLWMIALTAFLLIEKVFPGGDRAGRIAGIALLAWGSAVLLKHFVF